MGRKIPTELSTMCLLQDGGRLLMQRRRDPDWPGLAFPGGHLEPGESFVDCVKREVFEETGLRIADPVLCGVKSWENPDGSRYIVLLFRAGAYTGRLASSAEGEALWVRQDELASLPLAKGLEEMLPLFQEGPPSELFYRLDGGEYTPERQ